MYIEKDVKEKKKNNFIYFFIWLGIAIMACRVGDMLLNVIANSIQWSLQCEVRDYVGFRLTDCIMQGINPYSLENVGNMNIPLLYMYTPINPLLVAMICMMTGSGIITGNFILNILFVILTSIMLYRIIQSGTKAYKSSAFLIILLLVTTFFSMFGDFLFTFRSDSLGIFVYSCMLFCVYKESKRTVHIATLSVLLLLTKQNMIVLAIPVFLIYLLTDWKKAIKYALQCSAILAGLVIIIQYVFPLYWTETVFVQFLSTDTSDWLEAVLNIMVCIKRYFVFACIDAVIVIGGILYFIRTKKKIMPLIKNSQEFRYIIYLILNIVVAVLTLLYFARNGADGFKYCQEMLAVPMTLLALMILLKYHKRLVELLKAKRVVFTSVICLAVCAVGVLFTHVQFDTVHYSHDDIEQYKALYAFLGEYDIKDVFVDKEATGYFDQIKVQGEDVRYYDDGHITYFMGYPDSERFFSEIFYANEIKILANQYREDMFRKIENKEFKALAVSDFFSREQLESNYVLVDSLSLKNVCNGVQNIDLWVAK